jgi:phage tail protein X
MPNTTPRAHHGDISSACCAKHVSLCVFAAVCVCVCATQHGVYTLFSSLLHKLSVELPTDPIDFLIQALEQPHNQLKVLVLGPPGAGVDAQVRMQGLSWVVAGLEVGRTSDL